ncbi:uncharacterized protein LOC114028697 isoform X2 [Vombatus ursinus]|uniref:uncharacterized protein LOC114028697 isoform X2 n=1 Tax=Vombatus ursinus TaxID=29139 RepID=UPI000FFCFF4C|nr:uncharacterized protein LOC114028697 isoform X2 [Vombatus ursinus]
MKMQREFQMWKRGKGLIELMVNGPNFLHKYQETYFGACSRARWYQCFLNSLKLNPEIMIEIIKNSSASLILLPNFSSCIQRENTENHNEVHRIVLTHTEEHGSDKETGPLHSFTGRMILPLSLCPKSLLPFSAIKLPVIYLCTLDLNLTLRKYASTTSCAVSRKYLVPYFPETLEHAGGPECVKDEALHKLT